MTAPDAAGVLTGRELLLVLALARGASHDEAATASGFSKSTVGRRLREQRIRDAIASAHKLMFDQALGAVVAALVGAIETLVEIHGDPDMPASARVAAACKIPELALRFRDSHELLARIEAMEATFAARTGSSNPAGVVPTFRRTS